MGFFDNVKKGAKSYLDDYKKKSADNKKYRNEVNEAVKKARRESFKEEAVKQAQLRAKIQAKQKYNPAPQSQGGGMSPLASSLIYGGFAPTPAPAPQVVRQVVRSSPKKKKKKGKTRTRTVVKYVEKPRSSDPLKDLLRNLPQ